MIRLANFSLIDKENVGSDKAEKSKTQEHQKTLVDNLLKNIRNEDQKLRVILKQLGSGIKLGLTNAFEPLSSAIIIRTSGNLTKKIRETDKRMLSRHLKKFRKSIRSKVTNQFVNLLYRQSEGILWAHRIEQSREKASLYPGENINQMLEKITPAKSVIQSLPFYYSSLFSGSSSIGGDLWVGMEHEIEKGSKAIKRFINGSSGLLIISGERSSGKSSLSKHLANLHFPKQNIYNIRAPRESIADENLFEKSILKVINGQNNLEYNMEMLPYKSVIIINDLELWWERKPFGTQVVEKIIFLMRQYGHKILFIINTNQYALKIINQLSSLNTWALDVVFCQAFDARELRELIMVRHQAGGMKFFLDKKHEDEMSDWDYARLFNRFFNLSFGNPGYALNLWLAGIKKHSGNTLYIKKPDDRALSIPEKIPHDEIIYILQFILHRRFSIKKLAEIIQNDLESTEKNVRILIQKGILIEKFPGVLSLNPALEIHLVKKLKSLELL